MPPSNTTAETAIALSPPPQTLTLDFGNGPEAWYSYVTTDPNEIMLCFWAFYDFTKVDDLQLAVYQGPAAAPVGWPNTTNPMGGSSVPFQIPLEVGVTIYIRLFPRSAGVLPLTSPLTLTTVVSPAVATQVGDPAVNDDLDGFPLVILDPATGKVRQFFRFAGGGSGTVMPSTGQMLVQDTGDGDFKLYGVVGGLLVQQAAIPYPHIGSPAVNIPQIQAQTDNVSTFYCTTNLVGGHAVLDAIDLTGAVVGTWVLTQASVRGGGVNATNTIFYYVTAGLGSNIHRWDLVNNVALADLVTGVALHQNGVDVLVLADGTLVNYFHRNGFADLVHHLDATTGATLHNYTMPASPSSIDHLAPAIDDPVSFWVWLHNGTTAIYASTFQEIVVADGSLAVNRDAQQYEQGQYGGNVSLPPTDRTGHSDSCPFWIMRRAILAPTPPPPPVLTICPPSTFGLGPATMGCIQPLGGF